MRKHPQAFAHIRQDKQVRQTLAEHLVVAKRLRHEHGRLPNQQWLISHGYGSLSVAIHAHPAAFRRIPQDHKFKTRGEHLTDATRLRKKHGKLPGPRWLINHGYRGLYKCLLKHPEAFCRVTRGWKSNKPLRQHVQDAKRLAKVHGMLPHPHWLVTHGYKNLYAVLRRHREAFADIKQASKKGKSLGQHVQDAKRLAKEHGALPDHQWRNTHGYSGLTYALRQHPDAFAGLKRKGRTP